MILLIDNYDSFTYNLFQYLSELGANVNVVRNDEVSLEEIECMSPEKIVISPGPCTPEKAGISNEVIAEFGPRIPTLGVCLGHQCVGQTFGGRIGGAEEIMHGKISLIHHDGSGVFMGLPNPFEAIRYHSLVIDRDDLPEELEVTAWTDSGTIMRVRHNKYPIEGIQFHPESILTEAGLSFLGTGIPPITPSWGNMMGESKIYANISVWTLFFPGLMIAITVLGVNLVGDGLRDALDPKLRTRE